LGGILVGSVLFLLTSLILNDQREGMEMNQAERPSSPVDASSFQIVVGIDIGSQTCSMCTLTPDKRQVIKPTEFANAPAGFGVLQEKLEQLGIPPEQVLIGLEATSRYGENLYHFLESHGYQLCLLHPRQTHQFAEASGPASENG
jgi:transposase